MTFSYNLKSKDFKELVHIEHDFLFFCYIKQKIENHWKILHLERYYGILIKTQER